MGSKSITIGIDVSRANEDEKTGVGWYAWHLIENLKKQETRNKGPKGEDVFFIVYSRESLKGELAKLPENWSNKVLHWPPKRFWTQIRLSLEMLFSPPDVLFVPAHVFPIIHPKKTIMTVHDVAALKFSKSYNWFERWYTIWSAKTALKKLWKVIVPSEFTKGEVLKTLKLENIKTNKIKVVQHGYDKRYRKIETDNEIEINKVLNKYNIKKPFLLSVGRWEEKKNTARLIESFDTLCHLERNERPQGESEVERFVTGSNSKSEQISPLHPDYASLHRDYGRNDNNSNLQLVLVGKPGHGYEKVEEALEKSPNKKDIIMPGYVDVEDLVYLMNAAEAFVFPSLYEGFGLPVLEALATGTPVVASKGTSLEEVGGEACVYVDPISVESIAKGINMALGDSQKRKAKSEKGLERVKDFSWEKCAEETLKVILS